ncbi:uncharacterized protein [Mytilus edulis]|uniref:uncharacterized protein n=1 Tax=Mytilus edulis TaxID=6550 RepID=UPI0039F0E5C3
MDRPKRKVAIIDYKKFNNFGTSGIDDMAYEYVFQKMADNNSDRDELELHAEEDDMLDLMSDDENNKINEAAALIFTTPLKKNSKESEELKPRESDEELELRVKLLEEKKQRLKREQLNQRIKELEAEVDGLSKSEEKPKKKSKKSKDSVTIGELSLSVDLHMLKTQAQESLKSAHASGTRKNLKIQKSNLVGTVDDSSKCLHRENISVFEDYLLVQFRWSKTIQFGERVLEIPIVKNLSSPLCAFSAFKAMCAKFPALASSPAFLVLSGRKTKPVSYNMLQNFLKNIVEKIGLDPTQYSSHSFRRGGATWAFQCGVSSELIQLQGDWKSDAYKLYLRYGLNDKMQVSSKMMCRL